MNREEIVENFIEVKLKTREDFLKVKETLTRMGVAAEKHDTLYQSCYILHKKSKYYIVSFKELFLLDGLPANITDEDILRRNSIARLLEDYNLLSIIKNRPFDDELLNDDQNLYILPFPEKKNWKLVPKYTIGKKFNVPNTN